MDIADIHQSARTLMLRKMLFANVKWSVHPDFQQPGRQSSPPKMHLDGAVLECSSRLSRPIDEWFRGGSATAARFVGSMSSLCACTTVSLQSHGERAGDG